MEKHALLIGGDFHNLLARQKSDILAEIGKLMIVEDKNSKFLLQVVNVSFGSQIAGQQLELISGINLEDGEEIRFKDPNLRNYMMLHLKNLLVIESGAKLAKKMPNFFTPLREICKEDFSFLPDSGMSFGNLRSGSNVLDIPIKLPLKKTISHHILITATTGRGKSNLTSNLLYEMVGNNQVGFLVLDPHDEYYGRNELGLKDHPEKENIVYYTLRDIPHGARTLKIQIEKLLPYHFNGVVSWSDPQLDMLSLYYREKKNRWIESIILEEPLTSSAIINEMTRNVVKRRLMSLLDLSIVDNTVICNGVFDTKAGSTTIADILSSLEEGKIVIIDTSSFSGAIELLIGSVVSHNILHRYRSYARNGSLKEKPVISIVLEEAPRVLGKEILERGSNIFSTIAREGRKFNVGLIAITQLPSLIPRQILANMNTKVIMGIEMQPERESIISSSAHDLTDYSKAIASLDKGEAIITSNFSIFPAPVKFPLFSDVVKKSQNDDVKKKYAQNFSGINLS